ncbi:MAG TPA: amidohydrolase family protein [Burkholderiales bacterium]|nr:amidohydrolase family protein [Burkholderiales bacterium]
MTLTPIVDAHMHLWDPRAHYYPWLCDPQPIAFRYGDYSALRRPYLPVDYRADCVGWPVAGSVYVEAEWDPRDPHGEMDFVSRLRSQAGFPTVAIAQAWLDANDCAGVLEAHAGRGFVRGVRHKPKPGQMDDARWRAGYARLAPLRLHFELQAPWRQLGEAARLAADFPATSIVLNHAGLPENVASGPWREAITALARCENVAVKISGLGNLSRERRRDVIRALIELFGPRRAMFASNYPVDSLRMGFDAIFREFDEATRDLSDAQRRQLFHDNAITIYRMEQRHA